MTKSKLLVGVLLMTVLLGGYSAPIKENVMSEEVAVEEENIDLQIATQQVEIAKGDIFDARDLVVSGVYDSINIPIVDTQQVGVQEITFKAKKGLDTITVSTTVEVVENTGPEISYGTKFLLDYGEEADILDYFYGVEEDTRLEVIGEYDPYQPGETTVQLRATDAKGNVSLREITVVVADKPSANNYRSGSYVNNITPAYGFYNGYSPGWCTWWAAQRRADIGASIPGHWGDAINWSYSAANYGYATGNTPQAGAVVYFPGVNHVAFVESVNQDGSITISEMGWNYSPWNKNVRTIDANYAKQLGYIY